MTMEQGNTSRYSTGNAIKNENIIRRELNLQERDEHEDNE